MREMVRCSKIGVDCIKNDPVDVKCGGPVYLGFDFYVREEEVEELGKYIKEELKQYAIPFINIYVEDGYSLALNLVYDKEKISSSIKEEAPYLKRGNKR